MIVTVRPVLLVPPKISSPLEVAGCQLWLNFCDITRLSQDTAGVTPVTALGDPIGRVLDQSPNANHFTQATAGKRPTWQYAGGVFDGVDDVMSGANTGLNVTSRTVFVSWTANSVPGSTRILLGGGGSTNYYVGATSGLKSIASWNNTVPAGKNSSTLVGFPVGVYTKFSTRWATSGSNVDLLQRVNAASLINNYTDGHQTPVGATYFVGALNATPASMVHGTISHVLVYNRALTDAEIAQIEAVI